MVLADGNFATIAAAVREGRAVYDNLKKCVLFMLPANGGEALIVILAILLQLPLPITPAQPLLPGFFVWRVLMVSVLMMTGAMGLFLLELRVGTMAVNAVVVAEMFYLLNSRFLLRSVFDVRGLLGNRYVLGVIAVSIALQAAFTHLPVLQQVFGSTALSWQDWAKVVAAGAMVFVVAEFEKFVIRRLGMADRLASL